MGVFSFLTADKHESIKIGSGKKAYLLVPNEFISEYGCERITDAYYNGYGNFGGIDVYEFLCDMIVQANVDPEKAFKKPRRKKGRSTVQYYRDMSGYYRSMAILARAEENAEDPYLTILYGEDWKRELGITLFHQGANLPYGLKFSFDPNAKYEDINGYSKDDPSQGCY